MTDAHTAPQHPRGGGPGGCSRHHLRGNPTSTNTPDTPARPTIVLVHGAFADSSSWNGVIAAPRGDGHPVLAAANPLRGLDDDAAYLRSVLDGVDGPIVVAGHS